MSPVDSRDATVSGGGFVDRPGSALDARSANIDVSSFERRKRENQGAESAECGEGCPPHHRGKGLGKELCRLRWPCPCPV